MNIKYHLVYMTLINIDVMKYLTVELCKKYILFVDNEKKGMWKTLKRVTGLRI